MRNTEPPITQDPAGQGRGDDPVRASRVSRHRSARCGRRSGSRRADGQQPGEHRDGQVGAQQSVGAFARLGPGGRRCAGRRPGARVRGSRFQRSAVGTKPMMLVFSERTVEPVPAAVRQRDSS